jgi:hypothetical protein
MNTQRYCRLPMLRQIARLTLGAAMLGLGLVTAMFAGVADASASKQLHPRIHGTWGIYPNGSGIYVFSMRINDLPVRTRVTIRCTHLCSVNESRTVGSSGSITSRKFKNRKLRRGAIVAVRATKPGFDGMLLRLGILGNPKTKKLYRQVTLCIPAGTRKPKLRCSRAVPPVATTTVKLTTPSPDIPPPTVPIGSPLPKALSPPQVTAAVSSANEAVLSWSPVAAANGYVVYLDGMKLATLGAVTTFTSSPLQCETSYALGVQATSGSIKSKIATSKITTSDCPSGPEPVSLPLPGGLSASVTSASHLVITWTAVPGATSYNIFLNGSIVDRGVTATTYDYGAVACGRSFSPGVEALGSPGEVSTIATTTVNSPACPGAPPDTTPPSTPANLTEYFPSETGFTLGWNPSTDDTGVAGYEVYVAGAKIATVAPGSALPSLGGLGYAVSGLSCGSTYQVGVAAFDANGNTSTQAVIQAATTDCPSSVAAPSGVVATVNSSNDATLSWNAVAGADGYYLWLDGSRLLEVSGTSFDYGPMSCGHSYTLGVQTISGSDVSAVATAQITTNPC